MPSFVLLLFFLLLCLQTTALSATTPYRPTVQILLSCGSESSIPDNDKRSWDGDARSKYAPPNIATTSIASEPTEQSSSVHNFAPYTAARFFQSNFTYTFPVPAGPKFLRLYFNAVNYKNESFNINESFFTVTANEFTLASNFSAYLTSTHLSAPSFPKEFIINVEDNQSLNITFSPSPNSFAFINGIEIVSMPDTLYFRGKPIRFENQRYDLQNTTAMETLYRLNVGGGYLGRKDDTGMFREWYQDDAYITSGGGSSYTPHELDLPINYTKDTPYYTAPEIVYTTSRVIANGSKSLNWSFPINSGFHYLLRLHFCEIQLEVTKQNQRLFTISINNQIAEIEADVIFWTGGPGIPYFKDYVTWVSDDGRHGDKSLSLSLFPILDNLPRFFSALLNGLEIFKLSDSNNRSLAAANPDPILNSSPPGPDTSSGKKKKSKDTSVLSPVIGSVTGLLLVLLFASFLIFRRRRRVKDSGLSGVKSSWVPLSIASKSTTKTSGSGSSLPSDLCRHFFFEEIKLATGNFNDSFVIGMGGFGKVYKGYIDNGATAVAIKRLNSSSNQGVREFETEIQMLSKLRHLHLVSLIGYCDESGEMILVYDYMVHGTLRDHLYNSENSPLEWKSRLQILIGAAKGLHYLHTGAKNMIIHRDVKTTNILLDEKWVAKVSDFGLSKIGPTGGTNTHVSTMVKGSLGYLDPEYYRRRQLTEKSDVYSFGVVLFEVLCARPPIIPNIQKIQVNLAEWAKLCYKKGTLEQIVDPNLEGKIAPECLSKYADIATRCLRDNGMERPTMSDVVWTLEFAMQLQEVAENRGRDGVDGGDSPKFPSTYPILPLQAEPTSTDNDELFSGSGEVVVKLKSTSTSTSSYDLSKSSSTSTAINDRLKTETIFSEINNSVGR